MNDSGDFDFALEWMRKLCAKVLTTLNQRHTNLHSLCLKNTRADCGSSAIFIPMLVEMLRSGRQRQLRRISVVLHDLVDSALADLVAAVQTGTAHLEELRS